jgi:hypothetical protein
LTWTTGPSGADELAPGYEEAAVAVGDDPFGLLKGTPFRPFGKAELAAFGAAVRMEEPRVDHRDVRPYDDEAAVREGGDHGLAVGAVGADVDVDLPSPGQRGRGGRLGRGGQEDEGGEEQGFERTGSHGLGIPPSLCDYTIPLAPRR